MYRKSNSEGVDGVFGVVCLRRLLRSRERRRFGVDFTEEGVLGHGFDEGRGCFF